MAPPTTTPLQPFTPLSPAELSYLHTSLTLRPPIRPDSRSPTQFRPLTAELDILPTTYGSARMIWGDGGECIVGIKAQVEKTPTPSVLLHPAKTVTGSARKDWIEINVEVSGQQRDDDAFLAMMVAEGLSVVPGGVVERLKINERFHWKVYVDILLLAPPLSHPATLLTLTTHLALRDARLPRLTSEGDEDPMFDDDWENAVPLYPRGAGEGEAASSSLPPVTLLVVSVGGNIFFDPTREELAVGDVVLAVSVCGGRAVGVRTLEGGGGGVARDVVKSAVRESLAVADEVLESLKGVVEGG